MKPYICPACRGGEHYKGNSNNAECECADCFEDGCSENGQ